MIIQALLAIEAIWTLAWIGIAVWFQASVSETYRGVFYYTIRHQSTALGLIRLHYGSRSIPMTLMLICFGILSDIYNVLEISLHTSRVDNGSAWAVLMTLSSVGMATTVFAIVWLLLTFATTTRSNRTRRLLEWE